MPSWIALRVPSWISASWYCMISYLPMHRILTHMYACSNVSNPAPLQLRRRLSWYCMIYYLPMHPLLSMFACSNVRNPVTQRKQSLKRKKLYKNLRSNCVTRHRKRSAKTRRGTIPRTTTTKIGIKSGSKVSLSRCIVTY